MDDTISREKAINMIIGTASRVWDLDVIDTPRNLLVTGAATRQTEIIYILREMPSIQPEIVRCHKCIHWNRDTVRQNSNDAGRWNEAVCERHSDEIWTAWKDADWYCADAERRTDE